MDAVAHYRKTMTKSKTSLVESNSQRPRHGDDEADVHLYTEIRLDPTNVHG